MPPRINFTRKEILQAAINVIRESGSSGLTVRNIAEKMGGSTQPIYRVFGTIEELEKNLMEEIKEMAARLMLSENSKNNHFLSIGLGYLRFTREEPELFKYSFVEGIRYFNLDFNNKFYKEALEKMKKDGSLKNLDTETLQNLYRDMWIYTHGLATQILADPHIWSEENCYNLLLSMGGRLIAHELIKKGDTIDAVNYLKEKSHENNNS